MMNQIAKLSVLLLTVHIFLTRAVGNEFPIINDKLISFSEYRTINGQGNNIANPAWGSANYPFQRYGNTNSYQDGLSIPFGNQLFKSHLTISDGPNVRTISNIVFSNSSTDTPRSARGYTDFLTYWGQFIDHDMTRTPTASPYDAWPIPIPSCDVYFDPNCTGTKSMMFGRSQSSPNSAARLQMNAITSFMDASMVYGSDDGNHLW